MAELSPDRISSGYEGGPGPMKRTATLILGLLVIIALLTGCVDCATLKGPYPMPLCVVSPFPL